MSLYRTLFDHGATRIDAELAHRVGFAALRVGAPALRRVPPLGDRVLGSAAEASGAVRALGLEFDHVLGLAAGFDKNAVGIDALGALGFSHVEIGTVTAQPQPGNPQPRLFRLPADRAVLNRMGFNNDGAEAVARRLADRARRRRYDAAPGPIVGVNIGKTKVVPEEHAVADYTASTRLLAPYADYLVVNVSSPNTPGLRDLQAVEKLEPLLRAVRAEADRWTHRRVPLLVKIAPDLSDADVLATADLVGALELDGVIATNTTISRDGLATDPGTVAGLGAGGVSGTPVRARALEVLRLLRSRLDARVTVIGVGGIGDAADARERLAAGADLLQAYTGFIYGGPRWPRTLVEELSR